jgi:hypothetical protein
MILVQGSLKILMLGPKKGLWGRFAPAKRDILLAQNGDQREDLNYEGS